MNKFNIRVYGIYLDDQRRLLLTDEEMDGFRFTKFPGGGLEQGEGLIEALKREFVEECQTEIEVISHFYTTDFYVKSLFNDEQLIAIYYLVKPVKPLKLDLKTKMFDFEGQEEQSCKQSFRKADLDSLKTADLTFPVDQLVLSFLKDR